ncbi:hypothetical protein ACOKM3_07325 [Streptomyces sp. BH106]|uniref:hypothetical protein n=1 Tax=Streptomyces sp. BH106 TaxID=3410409 RepID=UPI003CFAD2B4
MPDAPDTPEARRERARAAAARPPHPVLTPEQDRQARGGSDRRAVGARPYPPPFTATPGWRPNEGPYNRLRGQVNEIGGNRPANRKTGLFPCLLLRGTVPGDRAARPLWPPTPCWESPDIMLMDARVQGPFDRTQMVLQPRAHTTYRVFVHVWNLGRFPAYGVAVRAWWAAPGFFDGRANLIGGTWIDMLDDRTQPGCHRIVEMEQTWTVVPNYAAHECLLASAHCAGDPWSNTLDPNNDRHVAQHNLTILVGGEDLGPLLDQLTGAVPDRARLRVFVGDERREPLITTERGPSLRELLAERIGEQNLTATNVTRVLGDGWQTALRFVADERDALRGGYTIVAAGRVPRPA